MSPAGSTGWNEGPGNIARLGIGIHRCRASSAQAHSSPTGCPCILLKETGFSAISAAKYIGAWSHEGRARNEGGFASLAGVNPTPASSGNTVRHRLNRGGDRSLNSALHMVAVVRMTHDGEARE